MNTRFALGLATYLAIWASLAAGIIYGVILAGYPTWIAVVCAVLVFIFGNGSIAYRYRARRARMEGKEPPPYFKYLFFPQGFDKSGGSDDSIVGHTGQLWKLWASYGVGFAGVVASAPFFWNLVTGRTALSVNAIFVALVLSSAMLWGVLLLSIVCPACNVRWFKLALGRSQLDPMTWLETLKSCPSCGKPAEELEMIVRRKA